MHKAGSIGLKYFIGVNWCLQIIAPYYFRDWRSYGSSSVEYLLANADASSQVWDITDPFAPVKMNTTLNGSVLRFSNEALNWHEYAAFRSVAFNAKSGWQSNQSGPA